MLGLVAAGDPMSGVTLALWIVVLVGGLAASGLAAGKALESGQALAEAARVSPFVVGLTVMAVGTDLPEIANSIVASAAGRGDLNVGDSTGSAATQVTFVLGLLCLLRPVRAERTFVASAGVFIVAALLLAASLMRDGHLSRIDGGMLLVVWLVTTYAVSRTARRSRTAQPTLFGQGVGRELTLMMAALAVVAVGAVGAVTAFGEITERLDVPEYATSFFVLSIGTSLPELLVDGRAVRRGAGAIALGDILGSSLVDSTLSLGIGPLCFPTTVSDAAASGTLVTAGVIALVVLILLRRRDHHRRTGVLLVGCYAVLFPLLIVA